jgi:predicted XRE-type DNA-binding protein
MKRQRFASVWDAIEDSPGAAASMKLRSELAHEIIEELKRRKLTQAKAAKRLNVTQPRISDLMRGRIDLFSLDALVDMAQLAGLQTKMTVKVRRAA